MSNNLLEAQNLNYFIGQRKIIKDVSLSLHQGEVVAIIGPNGAGKSTLLRLLTGYIQPSSGDCLLKGTPISRWPTQQLARIRAVMRQYSALSFPFSVEEVIAMGRVPHENSHKKSAIDEAIALTECEELRNRNYQQLSGGNNNGFNWQGS